MGRPRRVDEGGDVIPVREVPTALDLVVFDTGALGDHAVQVAGVHRPHRSDEGEVASDLFEPRGVVLRFHDARDRSGVGEVPGDLRRRRRLVDRNHHGAGEEQREVHKRPVVRGARDESDLVAGFDAGRDEALREGDDPLMELRGGDVAPAGTVRNGEESAVRRLFHTFDEEICDVRVGIGGNDGGDSELGHGNSFGTGCGFGGRV